MQKKQPKLESGILKTKMMNYFRAIFSGFLVWILVSISFYILDQTPFIKDFFWIQSAIVMFGIIFFGIFGAKIYFRKTPQTNGLLLGITMSATALILDVLITVPFVEIPNGRSYYSFFTSPVLWLLATINALSVYFYWRKKVNL
ncbi:DUF5367 domain-containing protein [Flavobacterium zhairuonense]|uniref:DUF5367 family protein n=1 Tax=Flavobacterium zhairuonense TaxID=2493631 RepID=UPI001044062D|nr:DUF5367 family protein [Flavobacterium zhairuonense]KAF2509435.1 DUF5367 domain-containing protein [Flavobacterium zhairuonense]